MLDYDLYGLYSAGHHMTNLLFHVANTLLLFLLLQRMTGAPWRSGFLAALFALHPLHLESVAWVAERKDVLSAFFWILTMWTYVRYVERPKLNRYLLVILCFALALVSKPMAVTLPFVLLLLDYWPLGRLRRNLFDDRRQSPVFLPMNSCERRCVRWCLLLEKVPLFALTVVSCFLTFLVQSQSGAIGSMEKLPLLNRVENALISNVKYIGKMIWPDRLAVLYPHPIILPLWEAVAAALLLTTVTVMVILVIRRRPYYVVGWLWYLGTLVPVIGLVQVGT